MYLWEKDVAVLREKDDAAGRPATLWLPALEPASRSVAPASLTSTADGHTSAVVSSNKD